MRTYLDFEKPIAEAEARLKRLAEMDAATHAAEAPRLQARLDRAVHQVYRRLGPWQTVQVARHPDRPSASDFLHGLTEAFVPLSGDRSIGGGAGLIGGLGRLRGYSVVVMATDRAAADGAPDAAGFRKARRLIRLADRLSMPLVTFVDVGGPEITGLARAAAIAGCVEAVSEMHAAAVAVVVGEAVGAAGHALTIADRTLILEYAVASAVTPEDAAEALWQDPAQVKAAAEALRPTARELVALGFVDGIVREPPGGAHRDPAAARTATGDAVAAAIAELVEVPVRDLRRRRRHRLEARASAEPSVPPQ